MNVLLFGIIAEKAGSDHLRLEAGSLNELRQVLRQRIPGLDGLAHAIAVDRVIVHQDMPLSGGEEIAVLPPFAGG
jgi:molybdopterin converting factor small subunit